MKMLPTALGACIALAICAMMMTAFTPTASAASWIGTNEGMGTNVKTQNVYMFEDFVDPRHPYRARSPGPYDSLYLSTPSDGIPRHNATFVWNVYSNTGESLYKWTTIQLYYELCHFEGNTIVRELAGSHLGVGNVKEPDTNIYFMTINLKTGYWMEKIQVVISTPWGAGIPDSPTTILDMPVANYVDWRWLVFYDPNDPLSLDPSAILYPSHALQQNVWLARNYSAQLDHFAAEAKTKDDLRGMLYPWAYEMFFSLSQFGHMMGDVESWQYWTGVPDAYVGWKSEALHIAREALNRVNDLARCAQYEYGSVTTADMMAMARETCDYYMAAHYYMTAYCRMGWQASETLPIPLEMRDYDVEGARYAAKADALLSQYEQDQGWTLDIENIHPGMALLLISGCVTVAAGIIVRRSKVVLPGVALVVLAFVLAYVWGAI